MSYPEAECKYNEPGLDNRIKQLSFQKFLFKRKGVFLFLFIRTMLMP